MTFEWSSDAIQAAARVICSLASAEPACRCGGGCHLVARRALAAALEAERELARRGIALATGVRE